MISLPCCKVANEHVAGMIRFDAHTEDHEKTAIQLDRRLESIRPRSLGGEHNMITMLERG